MGQLYRFHCPKCGYSAEVSGGDDAGEMATTTTIACRACRRLYDVPTAKVPEFKPIPLRCPRAYYHPIERWTDGDPCPRCGTPMLRDDERIILWD